MKCFSRASSWRSLAINYYKLLKQTMEYLLGVNCRDNRILFHFNSWLNIGDISRISHEKESVWLFLDSLQPHADFL